MAFSPTETLLPEIYHWQPNSCMFLIFCANIRKTHMSIRKWGVVIGAGSGIGSALNKKLVEKNYSLIGLGRLLKALEYRGRY